MSSRSVCSGQADIPDLSRVTFFDGQRLAADDLNDAATVQRELRWLHNRSLHNWGIGLGFAVTGGKGDRQVQIGPGYAVDCCGREIILTETIGKNVPARAGDASGQAVVFYLVAAYPDDAALAVLDRQQGECDADGAVRLAERAAIYWKAQGEQTVETGMEIVLAQAKVQNCQLAAPISVDQRRTARASQQPVIASGATPAGSTSWTAWTIVAGDSEVVLGVKTDVDTSEARFGTTPQYQARLRGERVLAGGGTIDGPFMIDGTVFVDAPTRNGFTLFVAMEWDGTAGLGQIALNPSALLEPRQSLLDVTRTNWSVVWVGVEA